MNSIVSVSYSMEWSCCTNQFESETPLTPDTAMPRGPFAGSPVQ